MADANDMIFLHSDDQVLQRVPVARYESEDLLERLIESYPELLVGDQIDQDAPPRSLLVAREAGIPGTADGNCDGPSITCCSTSSSARHSSR